MTEVDTYKARMSVSWLNRMTAAVEMSGRKRYELSKTAGFGVNYVSQMLTEGKMPGGTRLAVLCSELGIDQSWVLTGHPANVTLDPIVELIAELPEDLLDTAFDFLANRKEVSQHQLMHLSDQTGMSLDTLRQLSQGGAQPEGKPSSIAPLNQRDLDLLSQGTDDVDDELYDQAIEITLGSEEILLEQGSLKQPPSSKTRSKMVTLVYARLLAQKYAKK